MSMLDELLNIPNRGFEIVISDELSCGDCFFMDKWCPRNNKGLVCFAKNNEYEKALVFVPVGIYRAHFIKLYPCLEQKET